MGALCVGLRYPIWNLSAGIGCETSFILSMVWSSLAGVCALLSVVILAPRVFMCFRGADASWRVPELLYLLTTHTHATQQTNICSFPFPWSASGRFRPAVVRRACPQCLSFSGSRSQWATLPVVLTRTIPHENTDVLVSSRNVHGCRSYSLAGL